MAKSRRRFGALRLLPSGLWQARYRGEDGLLVSAPQRFAAKADADRWLALTERAILDGTHSVREVEPIALREYAARWMGERPRPLATRTSGEYVRTLRLYVLPVLGDQLITKITPEQVRTWHAAMLAATRSVGMDGRTVRKGTGATQPAKAYRLLHAILATAESDGLIDRNPCRLKGAGVESPPERIIPTVEQTLALAEAIDPRYKAMVLLAAFGALRWGELIGLRRRHLDLQRGLVRVEQQTIEADGHRHLDTKPKSKAGTRTVHLPPTLLPILQHHLDHYAAAGADGRVFVGLKGATPTRSNFSVTWCKARDAVQASHGCPATLHLHDLRHLAGTLAAIEGATLRELQSRLGHSTVRAALIYQHATEDRDAALALLLDRHLKPLV